MASRWNRIFYSTLNGIVLIWFIHDKGMTHQFCCRFFSCGLELPKMFDYKVSVRGYVLGNPVPMYLVESLTLEKSVHQPKIKQVPEDMGEI